MTEKTYLEVTQEAGKAFFTSNIKGPIVMLNLLKFRKTADYSTVETLAPGGEISGKEAYRLYMDHTLPFLEEAGSEIIFQGKSEGFLIGPEHEKWDMVLLVRHKSASDFLTFATHEAYLKGAGHRTAALEDSRLLPIQTESITTR